MDEFNLAIEQLARLQSFVYVEENLLDPPVSMPQSRLRAAGIDPDLWYGLGIVGVWASIDALLERGIQPQQSRQQWLCRLSESETRAFGELDDLRNLYAHNFAGVVDDCYLNRKARHYFKRGAEHIFGCGNRFKGEVGRRIVLSVADFLYYIEQARGIVMSLRAIGYGPTP